MTDFARKSPHTDHVCSSKRPEREIGGFITVAIVRQRCSGETLLLWYRLDALRIGHD
jgi:hypothetical protein